MSRLKLIAQLLPILFIKICESGAVESVALGPSCIHHLSDEVKHRDTTPSDRILPNGTIICDDLFDFCFSFWQVTNPEEVELTNGSADEANTKWLARGCFKNANLCNEKKCTVKRKTKSGQYFCCCRGNLCNREDNIEYALDSIVAVHPETPDHENEDQRMLTVILACGLGLAICALLGLCFLKRRRRVKSASPYPCEKAAPTTPCIDLNSVKFMDNIGNGRYGTVYRALLSDEEVAVKLIAPHNKGVFIEEKYVYSLPLMEHPNLLTFIGGGEMYGPGGIPSLGLVLSYCPKGRLNKFLSDNTVDFSAFCKIIVTLTRGLSHLHSEIRKADLLKPSIAHRDFNTRNILLKADMSCVVCDLGFAIHTQGAKFYVNGEERNAEMESLTDVGTHRYMAPEVLEGAVNLRDCETSLKQIDIYALGLVLWEIASRCHDLYQGMETPRYALPFSAELGGDPEKASFGQMQVLVARNKARPLFPSVWKDSNPAIRQLKETIEDCWDNDAEARLSAMCVERRLLELKVLWSRHKASLAKAGASPNPDGSNGVLNQVRSAEEGKGGFIISNKLTLPKERSSFPPQHSRREATTGSTSENTVETIVANSPLDLGVPFDKNRFVRNLLPLANGIQPHQGRNPCAERNTILEPKEPSISGNLFDGSDQLQNDLRNTAIIQMLESQHAINSQLLKTEHLVPLLNGFMPKSLRNERIHAPSNTDHRSNLGAQAAHPVLPPIPYLQNEVRGFDACPKRQNVGGGGQGHGQTHTPRPASNSPWRSFKLTWEHRLAAMLSSRSSKKPAPPSFGGRGDGRDEEQREILVTPTSSSTASEPPTPLFPLQPQQSSDTLRMNSKVLLSNDGLAAHTVAYPGGVAVGSQSQSAARRNRNPAATTTTEIGIARLEHQRGLTPAVRSSRPGSRDMNSSDCFYSSEFGSSLDRSRRPSTLPLQGDGGAAGVVLRHPKNRIKTPCNNAQSRLSLYGDSDDDHNAVEKASPVSLSRSLPYSMDAAETGAVAVNSSTDDSASDWNIERLVVTRECNGLLQHPVAANV